jgi:dephospho-CoA kinase
MIVIGILGDIGSGKSYVAKKFGYPVFNADEEVSKLYKKNKKIFLKFKKILPKFFHSFPINKKEILKAILDDDNNLKKIVKIVHLEIRKKMNFFLKKHKNKKIVILDIPLLLENKINKKNYILIFIQSKKFDILKKIRNRENYNKIILNKFRKIQLPLAYKRNKSQFIIKNNFTSQSVKKDIQYILNRIQK